MAYVPGDYAKVLAFLALLIIQTGVALLFKMSQRNGKYNFSPGSAQTTAEVCKFWISAVLFRQEILQPVRIPLSNSRDEESGFSVPPSLLEALQRQVDKRLLSHTGGLALLYCFNNQLAFALFRWADAASVTLVKSASSVVSAILLWLLLSRPITSLQWTAILLQVLGLWIVQYDSCKHAILLEPLVYVALFVSLGISSGAGVWNEHVLKTSRVSMHAHNCCLYAFGIALNLTVFCFLEERPTYLPLASAYFRGYNAAAVGVIFCQAVLGLVVTAVLKYADMVIRCLASACSVSALYAVNVLFLGWTVNWTYCAGCAVVFLSTYLYMSLGANAVLERTVVPSCADKPPVANAVGSTLANSWVTLPYLHWAAWCVAVFSTAGLLSYLASSPETV